MSEDSKQLPLITRKGALIDLLLAVLFFIFMREVLIPHVPSQDPLAINIVSSMTSFCMSGVFWIAAGMLRVTWVDYLRNKETETN
ncbi:hypothetical protein N9A58_02125 [Opitutales bacterium]|jgi:hypothetical protein|nr:hypothetical protein [Opitutales bacterium]MDG1173889.1 hypothetical protein [Opitutales bacterium]